MPVAEEPIGVHDQLYKRLAVERMAEIKSFLAHSTRKVGYRSLTERDHQRLVFFLHAALMIRSMRFELSVWVPF
jgi:hypothetical protein